MGTWRNSPFHPHVVKRTIFLFFSLLSKEPLNKKKNGYIFYNAYKYTFAENCWRPTCHLLLTNQSYTITYSIQMFRSVCSLYVSLRELMKVFYNIQFSVFNPTNLNLCFWNVLRAYFCSQSVRQGPAGRKMTLLSIGPMWACPAKASKNLKALFVCMHAAWPFV